MTAGDTFVAPAGPMARFPKREMKVIKVMRFLNGEEWCDAVPVSPHSVDRYWHSTYRLDEGGHAVPV